MLSSPAMTHVFVAPHPDDVALSCGGLVASLRELGQSVTILTVYSGGPGGHADLADYQREALGFGTKALHPTRRPSTAPTSPPSTRWPRPPACGAPWQADPARLDATQERANTQARQFWQRAAWSRSANITNDSHDDRPLPRRRAHAGHADALRPGRRGREHDAQGRGRALGLLHRGRARRPRPARRGPSRLRG